MKKPNQELFRIVRFAIDYPIWHTYGSDVRKHVYRAAELGLLEVSRKNKQFRLLRPKNIRVIVHWHNPWKEAIPVHIGRLAECHAGLNQPYNSSDGRHLLTKERILEGWRSNGDKLDAYILPANPLMGLHQMGIRYGEKESEYLSPYGDQNKLKALLEKYK